MRLHFFMAAVLAVPAITHASGAELDVLKQNEMTLAIQADTCSLMARTAFARLRSGSSTADEERDLQSCIEKGKSTAKSAHAEVKATFKKKKVPAELTEWRLEWMAAFDATALRSGETEMQYLQRVQEARSKAERATNKFEIAVE